mmetsp:Transcript_16351/g.27007  ORF Transcript_16351/g.27007 Transcript_16351/m.27007 type:complete len:221 (-) Transcript_16351:1587-2249(-)
MARADMRGLTRGRLVIVGSRWSPPTPLLHSVSSAHCSGGAGGMNDGWSPVMSSILVPPPPSNPFSTSSSISSVSSSSSLSASAPSGTTVLHTAIMSRNSLIGWRDLVSWDGDEMREGCMATARKRFPGAADVSSWQVPPTQHLEKTILFSVSVPVLSANRYSIRPSSSFKLESLTFMAVSGFEGSVRILTSHSMNLTDKARTSSALTISAVGIIRASKTK